MCPYHKNCIEGYVTNKAIAKRLSLHDWDDVASIPDEHLVWDTVATYLAIACLNTTFLLSPEVIVLEGGVMQRSILYPKIRAKFLELHNNYKI